jgi:hypothetical protein
MKRELFESFLPFIANYKIQYKTNLWLKNSENLDLRSFLVLLLGKNMKIYQFYFEQIDPLLDIFFK